jgi:hypothetical protein
MPGMEWTTVAEIGTAGGTLVLAVATFASVRSSNSSARLAERSLQSAIKPLLMPSKLSDEGQKVGFVDNHWVRVDGGRGTAEVTDDVIYLTMSLRNVGPGLALLNAWMFYPDRLIGSNDRPDSSGFHRLTRDLYIPSGDLGFWQGVFRDSADSAFTEAAKVIRARAPFTVDLTYGDLEGGQRMISRFSFIPSGDDGWMPVVSHHWNVDGPAPR